MNIKKLNKNINSFWDNKITPALIDYIKIPNKSPSFDPDWEIHGHMDGKISGADVIIGSTGTVKGDIEFGNNLKTENGADIDGYIKKTNSSKSKLTGDFLFKKKEKKEPTENTEDRPDVVNKEAIA